MDTPDGVSPARYKHQIVALIIPRLLTIMCPRCIGEGGRPTNHPVLSASRNIDTSAAVYSPAESPSQRATPDDTTFVLIRLHYYCKYGRRTGGSSVVLVLHILHRYTMGFSLRPAN